MSDMLACGTDLYKEILAARQRKVEHPVQRGRKSDTLKVANHGKSLRLKKGCARGRAGREPRSMLSKRLMETFDRGRRL